MTLSRRTFLGASLMTTAIAGIGVGAALSQPKSTFPDWQIGYRNGPASGFEPGKLRRVYGQAPAGFKGTLYRNGPAQMRYDDEYASHWFDGDGMIQKISFEDGDAIHTGRFVNTHKRRAEQEAGKFLAPGFGTAGDPSFAIQGPDDVNAANTSVMMVNGELLALWEAGSAIALDPETLATREPKVWRDDLAAMPFLAHPKVEPDGRIWNLAVGGSTVGIYRISATGGLEDFNLINIGKAAYIHDWAMTDRHLIILVQPWINELMRPPFVDGFKWRPEEGLKILIIDKNDLNQKRWVQAPARAFYHTGAAWEEADGTIRFDVAFYKEPILGSGGGSMEMRGIYQEPKPTEVGNLTQVIIPPTGDARLIETGLEGEFPQVDPRRHGLVRDLTAVVGGSIAGRPGAHKLSVQNWRTGTVDEFDFGKDRMAEEFLFVPKPGKTAEKDCWLVGSVLNTKAKATEIHVFEAGQVKDGPVCTWQADYAWPLGFHGTWA